jgi:branched-subunit amino acid transport protein
MKKRYDYIVSLKRPDFKKYDLISQFLLIASIIIFLFFLFNNLAGWIWYTLPVIIITAQIIYNLFERRKGEIVSYRIPFFIAALGFILLPEKSFPTILLTVLYIIPLFLERQIKFPEEIGFDDEGITINTFSKKYYPWNLINNVVLKDGLLTIDFKDNRLFQKEIEEQVSPVLESEFNEFCRSKLEACNEQFTAG